MGTCFHTQGFYSVQRAFAGGLIQTGAREEMLKLVKS